MFPRVCAANRRSLRQYFARGGHSPTRKPDHAVRPDAIHRALHDRPVGVIQFRDLLALIHQQREREVVLLAELAVDSGVLRIYAEYFYTTRGRLAPVVPQLAELLRS